MDDVLERGAVASMAREADFAARPAEETRLVAVVLCILSEAARHGASLTVAEVEAIAYLADRDAHEVMGVGITGDTYVAGIHGPRGRATNPLLARDDARLPWVREDVPGRGTVLAVTRSRSRTRSVGQWVLMQPEVDVIGYVTRNAVALRAMTLGVHCLRDAAYRAARMGRRAGTCDPAIDLATNG